MVTIAFKPRLHGQKNYVVCPPEPSFVTSLGLMLTHPNLQQLPTLAVQRRGYGCSEFGIGIEYPKRGAHLGEVRLWQSTRTFYQPEGDYLGTLAGLMRAHDWHEEAEIVEGILPVTPVEVRYQPDIYDLFNYRLTPFSHEAHHCLSFILGQRDLTLAQERARTQTGFAIDWPRSALAYLDSDILEITLSREKKHVIGSTLYNELLAQIPDALESWGTTVPSGE